MSFPRYERYKDSGVEWIGEAPEHWQVIPIKQLSPVRRGASPRPIDDQKYFDDDGEYGWVRIADVSASPGILTETTQRMSELGSSLSVKIQPGELFISIAGTVGKPCIAGIKACIHDGFVYFPNLKTDPRFLFYLFEAGTCYAGLGKMGTQLNLNTDTIGSIKVALPPPAEMNEMIRFLADQTQKIDLLIREQRNLIELLKEKRQAVISHAVTKGLNQSRKLKDSGLGWLGNIPVSWEIVGSRRLFRVRNERAWDSDQQLTASQKYGMLFQTDFVELEGRRVVEVIQGTDSLRHVEPNDFVISLRSFQGGIEWCTLAGSVTFHYVVLVPIKHVYPPFFAYLFKSMAYIQALRSTTNLIRDGQDLRYSHFVLIDLPLVPIEDQHEITSYLNKTIPRIDALRAEAHVVIERLQERRSALISAVVTGKIDVRKVESKEAA